MNFAYMKITRFLFVAWEYNIFRCNIWHKSKQGTPFLLLYEMPKIKMFYNIIIIANSMFFEIPFVHPNGIQQMVEWDTS
jgi:hypothetical protein